LSAAAGVALTVLAAALAPSPAGATPGDEWRVWINVKKSITPPLVLDIAGNPPAAASAIAVVSRLTQAPNSSQIIGDEQWRTVDIGGGKIIFRGAGTSNQFALSIAGNSSADGTQVLQYWYQPDNKYQQWTSTSRTQSDGETWTQFKNVGTGKCLAVAGAIDGIAPGDKVIIYSCGSGEDQWWSEYDS
jgi:hypothetical protein